MEHKNKYTGILDMNGVKINNGDDVLVHHKNTYPKYPFKCKVVYKQGWILQGKKGEGDGYHVYPWRHSIEVVKTDNKSIFITHSLEELKNKWFSENVGWLIVGKERQLLYKCFEEVFKLGQEQLHYKKELEKCINYETDS